MVRGGFNAKIGSESYGNVVEKFSINKSRQKQLGMEEKISYHTFKIEIFNFKSKTRRKNGRTFLNSWTKERNKTKSAKYTELKIIRRKWREEKITGLSEKCKEI